MNSEPITASQQAQAKHPTEELKRQGGPELGSKFLQLFQEIVSGTSQIGWDEIVSLANVGQSNFAAEAPEAEIPLDVEAESHSPQTTESEEELAAEQTESELPSDVEAVEVTSVPVSAQFSELIAAENIQAEADDATSVKADGKRGLPAFVLQKGPSAENSGQKNLDASAQNVVNAQAAAASSETAQQTAESATVQAAVKEVRTVTPKTESASMQTLSDNAEFAESLSLDAPKQGALRGLLSPPTSAAPASTTQATTPGSAPDIAALSRQALAEGSQNPAQSRAAGSEGGFELRGLGANGQLVDKSTTAKGKAATQSAAGKNQEQIVEQVKEMLRRAALSRDGNSISVRLNPPELGAMVVKVTERHGQIFARVSPESKDVENLLRSKINDVTQALVQLGFRADQLHISIGQEKVESEVFNFNNFGQNVSQEGQFSSEQERRGSNSAATEHTVLRSPEPNSGLLKKEDETGWVA